ncbi:MAG TPA: hypothetical protein VMM60_07140 [Ilumatobacter sp.]|nr:hypothetical protein [Ilumatobacter sp.]
MSAQPANAATPAPHVASNRAVVTTDDRVIADLPLGGATGNSLPGSTVNLDRCSAPVVAGGVSSNCTTSGGNQTGGAADSLFPIVNATPSPDGAERSLTRALPTMGTSLGSLLVVAFALLVTGNVARRVYGTRPPADTFARRATDRRI